MLSVGGVGGREREKLGLERWTEKGCRQTRGRRRCKVEESAWAEVWSRTGEGWSIGNARDGYGGSRPYQGERMGGGEVAMLPGALKVWLRSLDFILGAVRIMGGLVEGGDRHEKDGSGSLQRMDWKGMAEGRVAREEAQWLNGRPKFNRTDKVILSSYLPNSSVGLLCPGQTSHLVVP